MKCLYLMFYYQIFHFSYSYKVMEEMRGWNTRVNQSEGSMEEPCGDRPSYILAENKIQFEGA